MKKSRTVRLIVLLLVLAAAGSVTAAKGSPDLPLELTGTLHGAAYVIRVPVNWNGVLLVYAHGYPVAPVTDPDAAFLGEDAESLLLNQGYALAASGFRGAGYNVKEGIKDTRLLTQFFKQQVGTPERTILYGASMGSVITLASMEKYPALYDGGIPMCSLAAGTPRHTDLRLGLALAYDVTLGWPVEWGEVGDVKDDIDFWAEVYPKVASELQNPTDFGQFEFMRLVNGLPMGGYYQQAGSMGPAALLGAYFFTAQRAELEVRAGGPVAQNLDHVYRLTDEEKAYLHTLGVDTDPLLEAMNARTDIPAHPPARSYLRRYADFSGRVHGPVLMLHNMQDPICPVEHTSAYQKTITEAGNEELLVRTYTSLVGHCNFTPEQILTVVQAMDSWLETGTAPGEAAFPDNQDFVPGYEPGPWPQPPPE